MPTRRDLVAEAGSSGRRALNVDDPTLGPPMLTPEGARLPGTGLKINWQRTVRPRTEGRPTLERGSIGNVGTQTGSMPGSEERLNP